MAPKKLASVCPHDCPSTCALEIEVVADANGGRGRIGAVHGARDNSYTAGVICAKVARYAERIQPSRPADAAAAAHRPQGRGAISRDRVGRGARPGRGGVHRRRAGARAGGGVALLLSPERWGWCSATASTGCATSCATRASSNDDLHDGRPKPAGSRASARFTGPDPREMAKSDLIVVWGGNPVNTQVNVMTHLSPRAEGTRGEAGGDRPVPHRHRAAVADLHLPLRPGTDGALACASCTSPSATGCADRDYMARPTPTAPTRWSAHLASRGPRNGRPGSPGWRLSEIEAFARLYHRHAAQLHPPRLRLLPHAQRQRQHARGDVPADGDRRVAARGRRRVLGQPQHLPLGQDADRRAGRARPGHRA